MNKLEELITAGRCVLVAKYYDAAADIIKYTDKSSGQPATMRQIKLTLGLQTQRGKKIVSAILRVQEGQDPAEILAGMNLTEGGQVLLDVDSLSKLAPSAKGVEPTWQLRIYGAYPLVPKDATAPAEAAPASTQTTP